MQRVLIVDDDADVAEVLNGAICNAIKGVQCIIEGDFDAAVERLAIDRPDAVVLDLRQGGTESNLPGQATWRTIWKDRFCPIVVYTAGDGVLDPPLPTDHPFVQLVIKGSGTEAKVIEHLQSFRPLVSSIYALQDEINLVVQQVLRDTVGAARMTATDEALFKHAARRRVAALMDDRTAGEGRELYSWEQYLVPAFGDDPLMGDVLRVRGADWNKADAYRLVLSPSCDLVAGRNEATVLLAKCTGPEATMKALGLTGTSDKVIEKITHEALTQGFRNGIVPLPNFPDRIPLLSARLKDLEVVPYKQIGPLDQAETLYERVASIDSPFREQIAWAFLSTVARPGMPDRDFAPWARGIAAEVANAQDVTNGNEG